MKKVITVICFLFSFSMGNYAQNELGFEFDFARFKYDSSSVYMEFYYDLNPQNMIRTPSQNGMILEAIVQVELKDLAADTFYINKKWMIQNVINEEEGVAKNLAGVFGFQIPKGSYSLVVKAYDSKNPTFTKVIKEQIQINPYLNDKFSISDIELAANIKKDDADPLSLFYKNSLEIIPNPSMVYSDKAPVAFYYSEIYNLILEDLTSNFTLQKNLYNSLGTSVYKNEKQLKQGSNSLVEYGLLNLSKYPTDSYNLVFSLIDNKTKRAYVSSKRFYLYNPNVVDSSRIKMISAGVMGSEFALMSIEECDLMFRQAKYIATSREVEQYASVDSVSAKREFLFNFWKNRDTDPSTPQNEFKIDYNKRLDFVKENFSTMFKEGYLSDRGRVYLIYGEPDQRDFFPSEPNVKPYEIWFYNEIEGGANFIFGDISGFGGYELLHSTLRSEVKDENWMRRLSSQ